jgi:hypothetical protein
MSEKCVVCCDSCKRPTPKADHPTAGDAADHARHAGFVTRGEGIINPMTWHCPACQQPGGKAAQRK